jgi:hypothetical protein
MPLPPKSSYRLEEIAERWLIQEDDLLIYALDGKLELSVLLFGNQVIFGTIVGSEEIITEQRAVFAALPLYAEDLPRIFKQGTASVERFKCNAGEYARPSTSTGRMMLNRDDLVVTLEERQRFEREHNLQPDLPVQTSTTESFTHNDDYSVVTLGGQAFDLGEKQASVVRQLHQVALTGKPWLRGSRLLELAMSDSAYLGDLFKNQKRQLIESNGHGFYRLRLGDKGTQSYRAFALFRCLSTAHTLH